MVIEAIDRAGLNRVRIRNELAAVKTFEGVSGTIVFDNTFNDVGGVYLATVKNGRFEYDLLEPARHEPGPDVIGLLRPLEGERVRFGAAVEEGVRQALAESGRPLVLAVEGTRGAWSTVGEVARDLIEDSNAAGLVTALDPAGAHVAAQVATRLRRPIAVAGESPPLLAHTGVPWILTPAPPAEGDVERSEGDSTDGLDEDVSAAVMSGYLAAWRLNEQLDGSE
jgi:ABC-type branched-subunit amino acid transport system substrate-binding protein